MIMVNVNKDFPALARKIHGSADMGVIGKYIVGMRQARSGGFLIEVRGDPAQVEAVRAEISKTAGPGVKSLQQRHTCEIRDLDEWTTKEEITEAAATCSGMDRESIRVISLRKRYGGTQSALLSPEAKTVAKLTTGGRLRVGMVSCRIHQVESKVKYY